MSFYKINNPISHEYELLKYVQPVFRGMGISIHDSNGKTLYDDGIFQSEATEEDYDKLFIKKLSDQKPVYDVEKILNFHHSFYVENEGLEDIFVKHIRYIIMPRLKNKETQYQLIETWIKQKETHMLKKLLQEKNTFLLETYKNALEFSPSGPFSVTIRPIEFGESIGFDENSTKRMVQELVSDGFLTSTLGMKQIMVTTEGLRYLNMIESSDRKETPISLNIGNNSNVQFQNGSHNTNNLSVTTNTFDYEKFVSEIKSSLPIIVGHLSEDDANTLKSDVAYLDDKVKSPTPNKSILKTITDSAIEIIKKVPVNVLSKYLETLVS